MSKVSYASLKLSTDNTVKNFDYNGKQIEILNYLPIEDKYDLIMTTLQKSREGDIYNTVKLDMYFHLHLIYLYTNLSFTDKQREDEMKIYDNLKSNHFIDDFLTEFPEEEYNELLFLMENEIKNEQTYNLSLTSMIKTLINDLPKNAQAAMDMVNSFDKEKYQEVIDFAKAANGGRAISK